MVREGGRSPDNLQVVRQGRTAGEGEDDSSDLGIDLLMLLQVIGKEERLEEDILMLCKWWEMEERWKRLEEDALTLCSLYS